MTEQHAHQLLDQLDPGQFAAVSQLLEGMAELISRTQAYSLAMMNPLPMTIYSAFVRARLGLSPEGKVSQWKK